MAYWMDLRERIVAACDEVAETFSVSESWIRSLLRRRRETGSIAPLRHGGGQAPAYDAVAARRLR